MSRANLEYTAEEQQHRSAGDTARSRLAEHGYGLPGYPEALEGLADGPADINEALAKFLDDLPAARFREHWERFQRETS